MSRTTEQVFSTSLVRHLGFPASGRMLNEGFFCPVSTSDGKLPWLAHDASVGGVFAACGRGEPGGKSCPSLVLILSDRFSLVAARCESGARHFAGRGWGEPSIGRGCFAVETLHLATFWHRIPCESGDRLSVTALARSFKPGPFPAASGSFRFSVSPVSCRARRFFPFLSAAGLVAFVRQARAFFVYARVRWGANPHGHHHGLERLDSSICSFSIHRPRPLGANPRLAQTYLHGGAHC